MLDLILLTARGVAFYGGFKTGNNFASLTAVWDAIKKKFA